MLLQNDFPGAERAGLVRAGRLLAKVTHPRVEHPRAALRTFAQRFLAGEIHRRGRLAIFVSLVVAEIELNLELRRQFQHRGERFAHLAPETLQRPDLPFGDELLDFLDLKHPAAQRLPDRKIALFIDALELLVLLVDFAAAFRARRFQHAKIAGNGVVLVFFGALDDVPRHVGNLRHEFVAAFLPALDLVQLEFPIAGQFRFGQFGDAEAVEQFHQRKRLGRRLQLASVPVNVTPRKSILR